MTTTCQICGRGIKAKNGTIALHGYKRPGQGWQTASCFGARHRPYEVSCDALAPAIASSIAYTEKRNDELKELTTNPPATLTEKKKRDAWDRIGYEVTHERPADFNPNDMTWSPKFYNQAFKSKKASLTREIGMMYLQTDFLEKRLADWKAPE